MIFALRVTDVTIGTLRLLYMVRGARTVAAGLGFLESLIWITATTQVFRHLDNLWNLFGYALGFAAGIAFGITVEGWIAAGYILVRIIHKEAPHELVRALREQKFGVTLVRGEGRDGAVWILFVVAPRRRGQALLETVQALAPQAFVTTEPVMQAIGGYLPRLAPAHAVRK